jgi:O-Antigen ligase
VADSPLGGHRLHTTREQAGVVALGLAMVVSVIFTSRLADDWSWSYALTLVVLMVGLAVYLSRPGIAIAAMLLPFAVLDEGTPDVIPALRSLSENLYSDRAGGFIAPRDLLLVLAALAAAAWFPAAPDRSRRLFGRVTWVMIATGGCLLGGTVVGLYALHGPGGTLKGLRPFYDCVLAAFVVWRVLRSMPRARAERTVLNASLVVGGILLLIAVLRVAGLAGTPVEIEGVSITFFDAASPYVLLCCTGIWAVAFTERRVSGRLWVLLGFLVVGGLIAAIASQRRAILAGYAAAALALLVFNAIRRRGGVVRSVRILAAVMGTLALTLILVSIAVPDARDLLVERTTTALSAAEESSSSDSSLQYRVDESNAVYALAGRNLWNGIGPTAGFTPVNSVFLPTDGTYTHNTYYALPLRYGIWGILGLIVLVLGLVLRIGRGLFRDPPKMAWVLGAAILALLPAIATASFLTQTARWGIVLGGIVGAFDALTDPPDETAEAAA